MKLNENFALRQVAGTWVVIPLGAAALDFNGMLTLNETGAFLWQALAAGEQDLARAMTKEYNVSYEQAATDAEEFLVRLRDAGCLED